MRIKNRINKIRYYDYNHLYREILFYTFLIVLIMVIVLICIGTIQIYIRVSNNIIISLGFALICSIIYGGYWIACGFFIYGMDKRSITMFVFVLLFSLFIFGIGTLNVLFKFNFWLLGYKYFSLNSIHGLFFMLGNLHIFGFIWLISIPIMKEKKV